jgi:Rab GTPase-binding effector protein 1
MALAEATRRDLQTLTRDREKIVKEVKRLQAENDNLVGKHSVLAEAMASETINLPNKLEDMQLLLLTYREDLIAAKIGKERAQERLKSEVAFMKTQLTSEQQSKGALQRELEQELEEAKLNVVELQQVKRELELEKGQRRILEVDLQKVEARQSQTSQEKAEQVQAAQTDKEGLTLVVTQLKNKVASLQVDLDNSVAVQNDFVRLSQSLQVELEKIRQAEKEVRWQHEEDVDDCGSCRAAFSVTKRKHHCRHCGRVYCSDCVSKQVPSGPNGRTSRVCDVCHTLLSHHSAPYFSTEAPSVE